MLLIKNKSFKEVADEWLSLKNGKIRMTSFANYYNVLKKVILPQLGNVKIKDIDNAKMQCFVDQCIKSGYCKHSTRDYVSVIKNVLDYAVRMGYKKREEYKIEYQLESTSFGKVFSEDDYVNLIEYCKENQSRQTIPILIAATTGMRIGEICALKWGDIDFDESEIIVERSAKRVCISGVKSFLEISDPKTETSKRSVPIVPEVAEILKKNRLADGVYITSGNDKRPLEPRTLREKYKRLLRKIGLEDHTFHELRHTFASRCINSGIDAKTTSEILGHKNANMTLNIYTHVSSKRKKEAVERAFRT